MARPLSDKIKPQINIRDSYYQEYRQNEPNPEVDVKIYIEIVLGFILHLVKIIFSGKQVRIPDRLGVMGIKGKKAKIRLDADGNIQGLMIDHKATNDLWERDPEAKAQRKKIYHFNEHSDGYRFRLHWYKKNMNVTNKFNYCFRFSRANKRAMSKLIKNNVEYLTE